MIGGGLPGPNAVVAGEYRIVRPLSAGGMGSVYVAEQLATGKLRALKLMRPELVRDARLRQRFEQEARITARIESEHVVEVVGAGVDAATGTPWLAMELLEGEDLAAALARRGPLPPFEVRALLAQLGHALAAAHRIGIVHRDLKPENIFIARSQQQGVPFKLKVLDFGIAKIVAEAQTTAAATASVGTPRFMAPEQTEPNGAVTPATDVWALGLIAFQLLTGRFYWTQAAGGPGVSVASLLREVLIEPLVPASHRAAQYGCAHLLPPGFDAWFATAVARRPFDRFPDAAHAMAALDRVLAGAATGSVPHAGPAPAPVHLHPTGGQTGAVSYTAASPAAAAGPRSVWPWIALAFGVLSLIVGGIVLAVIFARPRAPSHERVASADLSGDYVIASSQNPGGGSYAGTVHLARSGDAYRIAWTLTVGAGYEGVALPAGDTLAVGWAQGGRYGVAVYTIDGGELHGRWVTSDATTARVEELRGSPELRGPYTVVRSTGGYTGTVTFTPSGEAYAVTWNIGRESYRGVGIRRGRIVTVGWAPAGNVGVVTYEIAGATLVGRWATLGETRLGSETLQRN